MVNGNTVYVENRRDFVRQLPKAGKCAELGVYECHFSKLILEENQPSELWLIDAFHEEYHQYPEEPKMWINHELNLAYANELAWQVNSDLANIPTHIEVIQGLSVNAVKEFEDETLDWVYVDASHAEDDVRFDLDAWAKKVKHGGYICGHDYPNPLLGEEFNVNGGVRDAVNDFCKDRGYSIDIISATVDGLVTSDDVSFRFKNLMYNFYRDLRWRCCDFAILKRGDG